MNKTKKQQDPKDKKETEEISYLEKNRDHKKKSHKNQFKGNKMNRNDYRYN